MQFLTTRKQTFVTYKNIRVQRQHKNICTPHVIRSPMVPSFYRLDLPQPCYGFIKILQNFYEMRFCTKFYNDVILKISACAIMPGFCKSGHKCYWLVKYWLQLFIALLLTSFTQVKLNCLLTETWNFVFMQSHYACAMPTPV